MDTAYKTRAWWMLRALTYFHGTETAKGEQSYIYHQEGRKAAANAVAPAGSEALTRIYVDRQGNTLPQFIA